jgi:hypothetical protein
MNEDFKEPLYTYDAIGNAYTYDAIGNEEPYDVIGNAIVGNAPTKNCNNSNNRLISSRQPRP